jgi:hypothetical protein
MDPTIMNVLSDTFVRAFPIKGLQITEMKPKTPTRTPISISVAPCLDRYIGSVGRRS